MNTLQRVVHLQPRWSHVVLVMTLAILITNKAVTQSRQRCQHGQHFGTASPSRTLHMLLKVGLAETARYINYKVILKMSFIKISQLGLLLDFSLFDSWTQSCFITSGISQPQHLIELPVSFLILCALNDSYPFARNAKLTHTKHV